MNYILDDISSQNHHEYALPLVARTTSVTKIPPNKTITFFKKGDPHFSGVRMVVNQRMFKSFNALMDELSHHIPLSFGVRTITTPQGMHYVSSLEELEDGGCYVCSDRNPSKALGGSYRWPTVSSSSGYPTQRINNSEGWQETPFWQGPKAPKKLTLVKNGDTGFRRSLILSSKNTQNLKTFLNDASEVLHFPVNHLYRPDGRKVESLQCLLQGPSIVVCAGQEPFRPMALENSRIRLPEKFPGLTSKKRNANWELKAKKSVIHSRPESSNRSRQFSLASEKSYLHGSRTSVRSGSPVPTTNTKAPEKSASLLPFGTNDDIEKKVHVNKDGSLSVEMKVRFQLLSKEMLQWSTNVMKTTHLRETNGDDLGLSGVALFQPSRENNVQTSSEVDNSTCPNDTRSQGLKEISYQGYQQPQLNYEIWKNPVYVSKGHEAASGRSSWITQSPCSGALLFRQAIHQTKTSGDRLCTTFDGEPLECSAPGSSCYSGTLEDRVQCSVMHQTIGQRNLTTAASSDDEGKQEHIPSGKNSKSYGGKGTLHKKTSQKAQGTKIGRKWTPDEEEGNEACSLDYLEYEVPNVAEDISALSACSRCKEKRLHMTEGFSSTRQEGVFCSYMREAEGKDPMSHFETSFDMACGPSRQVTPHVNTAQEGYGSSLVGPSSLKNKVLEAEENEHSRVIHTSSGAIWKVPRAIINGTFNDLEWSCIPHSSCPSSCRGSKGWGSPRSDGSLHKVSQSFRVCKGDKNSQSQMKDDGAIRTNCILEASPKRSLPRKISNSPLLEKPKADSRTPVSARSSSKAKQQAARDPGSLSSSPHHLECLSWITDASNTRDDNPDQTKLENGSNSHHSDPNTLEDTSGTKKASVNSLEPRSSSRSESSDFQGIVELRNEKTLGNHPRVSLEMKIKESQVEESDSCRSRGSSQSSKTQPYSTSSDKLHVIITKGKNDSVGPGSWTGSVASRCLPTPPIGMPYIRKSKLALVKHTSGSSSWNDNLGRGRNLSSFITPGSRSVTSSQTVRRGKKGGLSPGHGKKTRRKISKEGKPQVEKQNLGELKGSTGITPSDLPSTSPEEVVYEWLSKIPEEFILMSYDIQDDNPEAAMGAPEEDLGVTCSPAVPREMTQAQEHAPDRENSWGASLEENPKIDATSSNARDSLTKEKSSSTLATVVEGSPGECADSRKTNLKKMEDLSWPLYSSVQIMKTLLKSKQNPKLDRFNSFPEVSETMGRKLSHSAHVLITCLASLHFFDEEPVTNQLNYMNSPKYQELLSIFQTLWTECSPNLNEPSSKVLPSTKLQAPVTGDFSPTSSSGVDVSSGSGGSGEGSMAGVVDCGPFPEKLEDFKLKRRDNIICRDDVDLITAAKEEKKKSFSDDQVKMKAQSTERDDDGTSRDGVNESMKEQMLKNSMRVVHKNEIKEVGMEREKILGKEIQEMETQNETLEAEKIQEEEKQAEVENHEKVFMERMEGEEMQEEEACKECSATVTCPPVNLDESTEQISNPSKDFSNSDIIQDGQELELHLKEATQVVDKTGEQSVVNVTLGTGRKRASIIQNTLPDPDPLWVLRLLKKIEKEFMTHYSNAMSDFKNRWNLQNNEIVDHMIIELKNEMNQRIQKSIEKELRKIQSRAGKKLPKPPKEDFRWEASLQTEQRRRRLKGIRNHSTFTEQNKMPGKWYLSLAFTNAMVSSGTLGDDLWEVEGEEEYCPCNTCIRKKMTTMSLKNTTPATDVPLRKAFDLQQILLEKKEKLKEGAVELATEDQGSEVLQREYIGNEAVKEVSYSSMNGADAVELNYRSSKDKESEFHEEEEQETNHEETMTREEEEDPQNSEEGDKEGKSEIDSEEDEDEKSNEGKSVGDGSEKKEIGPASEYGVKSEGNATEDGERCSEVSDGDEECQITDPISPEAEVEKQIESQLGIGSQEDQEGNCQERPGEIQTDKRSEENNSDQDIRDGNLRTDHFPETPRSSQANKEVVFSSNSSTANWSQTSQRGSEKEGSNGDCPESESLEAEPRRESDLEKRAFTMYPENSSSDQDGMLSCSSISEEESTGNPNKEHKDRQTKNSKFTEVINEAYVVDEDCLDF